MPAFAAAAPPLRLPPRRAASRHRVLTRCSSAPLQPPPPLQSWPAPRSWSEVALSKLLDTLEDVALIARRTVAPNYTSSLRAEGSLAEGGLSLASSRPVVLILGSGWAAHSLMKVVDTDAFEVIMVSPRNHFLFTPMLPRCEPRGTWARPTLGADSRVPPRAAAAPRSAPWSSAACWSPTAWPTRA